MRFAIMIAGLVSIALLAVAAAPGVEPDSDGDGIADFREVHKHATDPRSKDSDGDGVPDGEWNERSEFAYTVRTVVRVLKPVDASVLEDDFQDARVVWETDRIVEMEVIHYPFATVNDAIAPDPNWRKSIGRSVEKKWLEPGPTANFDAELARAIAADLKNEGVDAEKLDDKALVEAASRFLLQRAECHDGFSTFLTTFEKGRPRIPGVLAPAAERGRAEMRTTNEEQWKREIFAKGMYESRARGSCTSSAIYLNGCLRALGIPTRIVLCIPAVDANDESEMALVRTNVKHPVVRRTILKALEGARGAWTSHTFNEVFVGGRWRRLNYDRLGQGILDEGYLGLMTHIGTYRDWADADMPATWGLRQGLEKYDDEFGGPNPYSAVSIEDRMGAHAKETIPTEAEAAAAPASLVIERLVWNDSPSEPEGFRKLVASASASGGYTLLGRVAGRPEWDAFERFTESADSRFFLEADGHAPIGFAAHGGGVTYEGGTWVVFDLGTGDRAAIVPGVAYRLRPRNERESHRWIVAAGLTIARP